MAKAKKPASPPPTAAVPPCVASSAPASVRKRAMPKPHADLDVTTRKLHKADVMHRVHQENFAADQFNPMAVGNARFSPISDVDGKVIPTIYAATTFDGAAMETVFHDVPFEQGFKPVDKAKLKHQSHSTIQVTSDLVLADLGTVWLRKLGVAKTELIESDKDQYPDTRKWAEAMHAQRKDIQGLSWMSRQDDRARAVVLFGDRIKPGVLQQTGASRSLLGDPVAHAEVLALARSIGVTIVDGT